MGAGRSSRYGRARRAVAVAAAFVVLGGCTAYRAADTTRDALRDAGHDVLAVGYVYDVGSDVVAVTWRPRASALESLRAEEDAVARVVWEASPLRVEGVDLVPADLAVAGLAGVRSRRVTRVELEAAYGPRDRVRDGEGVGDFVQEGALAALGAGAATFAALGLVATVVTVRQSRRRAPLPPVRSAS